MKIHLRDKVENPENWKQSPHIEDAIREGIFTLCGIIAEGHIGHPHEVTCCRCRELMCKNKEQS